MERILLLVNFICCSSDIFNIDYHSSQHFFVNLLLNSPFRLTSIITNITLKMSIPPKKNPKPPAQATMKASSHGTVVDVPPNSTNLVPSPAFSPEFSEIRLNMRRAILRSSSSKSVGEAKFDDKIERELDAAEKMERKWLERVKGGKVEGVMFGWVWVA